MALFAALCAVAIPADAQQTPGLVETRERLTELVTSLSDAETTLGELEARIEISTETTELLQVESDALLLSAQEAVLADFVQSSSGTDLLASEDVLDALRANTLNTYVLGGNEDALESYRSVQEDIRLSQTRLEEAKDHQDTVLAELVATTEEISVELAKLEEIEAQRLEEVRRQEEARRQAEAARKAEERRLAEAAGSTGGTSSGGTSSGGTDTTAAPTPSSGSGLLTYCPVAGAVSFIDSWGYARSGGRRHKGVDMMASIGTPVAAPVAGTVTLRSNGLGGRSFHLKGDDGNYYYGTHMSAYGESGWVSAGTIIGYVGDDGNAKGIPHLHFEIHPGGGAAVNPYPATNAAC